MAARTCACLAIIAAATATATPTPTPTPSLTLHSSPGPKPQNHARNHHTGKGRNTATFAAKPGGFSINSIFKNCQTCGGKGAIECPGCKGTGKNRKNGNIFERWKCFDCQGFGLKSCPACGKGGLTPEQRGER